jgi:glutaredoxin
VITLTLYSRPGCHLCDEMKATIDRVGWSIPISIDVVDISKNAALEALYGLEIPVLFVDGKKAAKYRIAEEDLRKILSGRTRATWP